MNLEGCKRKFDVKAYIAQVRRGHGWRGHVGWRHTAPHAPFHTVTQIAAKVPAACLKFLR
jgi:hypothetical protein